ncbi:glycosyltransferase [Methylobacterium sp. R2-1]|uniref:glycosyltransferase n=1 Tax=Methylobacterium sp. R2-1 TaxID=2587064 RepID=UPI00161951C9|nr:glycosyltransferase [Methylobacterium sp. R2-1]MBB2960606.1 glycosyltransferase involved in cell wall biosynthesis [Methylobacterium sp. R2-1]
MFRRSLQLLSKQVGLGKIPRGPRLRASGGLTGQGGFDPVFYRRYYPDLAVLGEDGKALREHYVRHGRKEGRARNAAALIAALERDRGPLPKDFIPEHYRALYDDLASLSEPWELSEHYLRFGRSEGRAYRADLSVLDQEYERLLAPGAASGGRRPAESFVHLLVAARVLPGRWLDLFVLHEFALLNEGWLTHTPTSRMEGLVAFLTEGVDRLAPISLSLRFDPAFYRSNNPDAPVGASDADLYRHWLGQGIQNGEPGTEAAALVQLLGEERFPESFDEAAYRSLLPEGVASPQAGRLNALRHFITTGFQLWELEPVRQVCSAQFLERIGEYHLVRGNAIAAKEAFDRSLKAGLISGRLHHRRGDALRALSRTNDAARAFANAADVPGAVVWSHIHAIDGLLAQPSGVAEALDRVQRSAEEWHANAHWRSAAHRALVASFALTSEKARADYAAGRRQEADDRLTACLDQISSLIEAVDPLPAPLAAPANGHLVIVANRDLPQCDHYRVVQKIQQLEHGGWTVEVFTQDEAADCRPTLDRAAAVIFYRVAAFPGVLHAILYARALGLPTIYEIDDIVFDAAMFPDPLESFEGQITPKQYVDLQYGVPLFRYAMQACDIGLASTPALAERMRPLVRSGVCHILRNGLDTRNLPFLKRPRAPFSDKTLTIFYGSGTRAHNKDFNDLAAPALLTVMERNPHVRLVIAGYLRLGDGFRRFAHRVRQLGFTDDVAAYWEALSGADINLAVLAPGPFADAKSEIKWLEAAMCGIPSIVSATRTYREILLDRQDALLAETVQDWTKALTTLIGDPALRRKIGDQAREKAVASYGLDAAVEVLNGIFAAPPQQTRRQAASRLPADTTPPPPGMVAEGWADLTGADAPPLTEAAGSVVRTRRGGKPRILVINVYFPPQTVGGATRVVRDNIDHILDQAADRFELAVAASDMEAEPPYQTRIDAYRGIPVFRIATPRERNMDWRPFNPSVRLPFEALLDRFEPDLVHVHCVQQLTASVVEAVRARGIPYVVTVHDAWWISDFQFLIDEDGLVQMPSPDILADASSRSVTPTGSIARRRGLARMLNAAATIAAVSEPFADIYRKAGFPQTIAIPNGVPRLTPVARRKSSTDRVRLGHIGGRTAHKGATLVEAILRAGRFENLSLTLVDHARATDYVSDETWGATSVRIVGKVPQEQIGQLYAEMDVLLAPSLWPESFGLVTREAHAAGLWVVASQLGAIGEDIDEGVNGFRVDVRSPDGLRAVFQRINADPGRFRTSPPQPSHPPRTAADQGEDLIALYDRLLAP